MAVDAGSEAAMASSQGRPLEPGVQAEMEGAFGADGYGMLVYPDTPEELFVKAGSCDRMI